MRNSIDTFFQNHFLHWLEAYALEAVSEPEIELIANKLFLAIRVPPRVAEKPYLSLVNVGEACHR
jgi:hypothetical protein